MSGLNLDADTRSKPDTGGSIDGATRAKMTRAAAIIPVPRWRRKKIAGCRKEESTEPSLLGQILATTRTYASNPAPIDPDAASARGARARALSLSRGARSVSRSRARVRSNHGAPPLPAQLNVRVAQRASLPIISMRVAVVRRRARLWDVYVLPSRVAGQHTAEREGLA